MVIICRGDNLLIIIVLTQVLKKYEEEEGRYLICGTNAYKPECRDYVEVVLTLI